MKNFLKKFYESAVFSVLITIFLHNVVIAFLQAIIYAIAKIFLLQTDLWEFVIMYGSFIAYWIVLIPVMYIVKRNRPFLQKLGKNSGNTLKLTLIGALLGFITNGISVLAASLTGQIFLSPNTESTISGLVLLFFCVLIQSGAEELVARNYLYQRIKLKYPSGIPSLLITAAYFSFMHINNDGINTLALVDLFLSGIVFAELIYYFDAFWACTLFHTMWNYTQSIIFGLPNSGIVSVYSIFKLDASSGVNSFVYNNEFGVEGTGLSIIVLIITSICIFIVGEKKKKKEQPVQSLEKSAEVEIKE